MSDLEKRLNDFAKQARKRIEDGSPLAFVLGWLTGSAARAAVVATLRQVATELELILASKVQNVETRVAFGMFAASLRDRMPQEDEP